MKLFTDRKLRGCVLTAAAAILVSANTYAGEPAPVFTMTVFEDMSFGRMVTMGDYEEAIAKITSMSQRRVNSFESRTNLCVAYTKSGDLENATDACNAAVAAVRKRSATSVHPFGSAIERTGLALALSNRGVLHAALGDIELARNDFVEAIKLRASLSAPKVNLARLDVAAESSS